MNRELGQKNYRVILEYDGTSYHGWQRQKGVLTVQEVVENCLAIMTQEPVCLIGAGRTDAGVHARGQVANFLSRTRMLPERLLQGLNSLLPNDIVALMVTPAPRQFHARFRARSKVYDYRIHTGPTAPAIGARISESLSFFWASSKAALLSCSVAFRLCTFSSAA